jgi:transposase
MPKGISDTPTFKPYVVGQGELIPPTTDELIPENHLVRIVNATLDQLDLAPVLAQYSGAEPVYTHSTIRYSKRALPFFCRHPKWPSRPRKTQ